jgi:hypothetical protein
MKHQHLLSLFVFMLFIACGLTEEEKAAQEKCRLDELETEIRVRADLVHTFDKPFPKRNRNLARILGDVIEIEGRCQPLTLGIVSTRKSNIIINLTQGDTIFNGTVCKYRDLYYLNEKINDTTYRIFALKITDSLIYGLQNYLQYAQIDSTIEHGDYSKLVYHKKQNTIRLHPNKRELRKLYTSLLYKTPPFVIIKATAKNVTNEAEETIQSIEADDYDLIANVYPNPATDILNIQLHEQTNAAFYLLSDLQGKTVLQGPLQGTANKVDISRLAIGTYALTVSDAAQQTEIVKVIKVE